MFITKSPFKHAVIFIIVYKIFVLDHKIVIVNVMSVMTDEGVYECESVTNNESAYKQYVRVKLPLKDQCIRCMRNYWQKWKYNIHTYVVISV